MNSKISNLKVIYDRETATCVKAYVELDGVPTEFNDNAEIRNLLTELKAQKGVSELREIKDEYELVYTTNTKDVERIEKYWEKINSNSNGLVLVNENPYDNAEVEVINIDEEEKGNKKRVVIAGAIIALAILVAGTGFALSRRNKNANKGNSNVVIQEITSNKVELPSSFEDFMNANYENSTQQKAFVNQMNWIESNIITKTNEEVENKYFMTPELATAFNAYYNTFDMENSDILSMLGDYDTTELGVKAQEALGIIRYSMVLNGVSSAEDMIMPLINDEEVNTMYGKYTDLWLQYKEANTKKAKKKAIKNFENAFTEDFIGKNRIDMDKHPSASIILQVFPQVLAYEGNTIDDKLYVFLCGKETNADDIESVNGLVDSSCALIDAKIESFNQYRNQLLTEKASIDAINKALLVDATSQEEYDSKYTVSKYDELTKETFEVSAIENMMDERLVGMGLDPSVDMLGLISEAAVSDLLSRQIEANPVEKALQDSINEAVEEAKKENPDAKPEEIIVTLPEEVVEMIPEEIKQEARQEAEQKTGIYDVTPTPTQTQGQKEEEVREEVKQNVTLQAQSVYDIVYAHYTGVGDATGYDPAWATSTDGLVAIAYMQAVSDANDYLALVGNKTSNQTSSSTTTTNPGPVDTTLGEYAGSHENNPNQPHTNEVQETPTVEGSVVENTPVVDGAVDENNSSTEQTPTIEETPEVEDNTQNLGDYVIEGSETYDPSGVTDMSQFGDISGITFLSDGSVDVTSLVDYMADPESPINQNNESQSMQK